MDTDEAFLPQPPVPPVLQTDPDSAVLAPPPIPPVLEMKVDEPVHEEATEEPETLVDLDAIAEAKARAKRQRKQHMTKRKQEPVLHTKTVQAKQHPTPKKVGNSAPAFPYLPKSRFKARPVTPNPCRRTARCST